MTTLYRIYGEKRSLLYVGITDDYDRRMRDHSEKYWWRDVRQIETVDFASREEASAAETCAIKAEAPTHNRAGNIMPPLRAPIPSRNSAGKRTLVSLADAAEYAGVCSKTIRRYIADGKLSAYRMGPRLIRVDVAEVDALLSPIPTVGMWAS